MKASRFSKDSPFMVAASLKAKVEPKPEKEPSVDKSPMNEASSRSRLYGSISSYQRGSIVGDGGRPDISGFSMGLASHSVLQKANSHERDLLDLPGLGHAQTRRLPDMSMTSTFLQSLN